MSSSPVIAADIIVGGGVHGDQPVKLVISHQIKHVIAPLAQPRAVSIHVPQHDPTRRPEHLLQLIVDWQ